MGFFLMMYVGALAGYTLGAMIGGAAPGDNAPFEGGGIAGIVGAIIGIIIAIGLLFLGAFTGSYLDD